MSSKKTSRPVYRQWMVRYIFYSLLGLAFSVYGYAFSASVENDNDDGDAYVDTWGHADSLSYSSADLADIAVWGGVWKGQIIVFADDDLNGLYSFANDYAIYTASTMSTPSTYGNNITDGHGTSGKTHTEFDSWLGFFSSSKNVYGP